MMVPSRSSNIPGLGSCRWAGEADLISFWLTGSGASFDGANVESELTPTSGAADVELLTGFRIRTLAPYLLEEREPVQIPFEVVRKAHGGCIFAVGPTSTIARTGAMPFLDDTDGPG
jgi:hypothetical protein